MKIETLDDLNAHLDFWPEKIDATIQVEGKPEEDIELDFSNLEDKVTPSREFFEKYKDYYLVDFNITLYSLQLELRKLKNLKRTQNEQ